ncbi:MAG TPA: hypothetical protein ACFYD3_06885 [Candidatus Hypogeohydataceae bacterium YC41]
MINVLLEALQEIAGLFMTSNLVQKLAGFFFLTASLLSGVALLVTIMYLASPEGFQKRLNKVLVEKPVVATPLTEKKAERPESSAKGKKSEKGAEAE